MNVLRKFNVGCDIKWQMLNVKSQMLDVKGQMSNVKGQMLNVKGRGYKLNDKSSIKYRSYCFAKLILEFAVSLPNKNAYWAIQNQLIKSGTSIGANIIEAQAASSRKEFKNFYRIALKSANETKFWLCLLRDSNMADGAIVSKIINEAVEIANMIASAILTLSKKT